MGNLDTTNMRIHWLQYDTFLNIKVATSATTEVLKGLIEAQSGVPASEQRLICNQCELLPRTTLDEQSLKTNSVATLLEQPEERVCPEWLATGRCHMKGCCLRATHTMEYSPRYLAHHIKQSKRVKQNQDPAAIPRPPSPPELEMHYAPSAPAPFAILQRPTPGAEQSIPMLSPSAAPFVARPQTPPLPQNLSPAAAPFTPPRSVTTTPELIPASTSLSPTAAPFHLPCSSPQRPSHSPRAAVATVSWDCPREVPLLQSPPRDAPSIGRPLIHQPVPRRIDPTRAVSVNSPTLGLPWDTSQDAELVGGVAPQRVAAVGLGCGSPLACCSPIWSNNASLLQWGKLNYEPSPVKRGLKREASQSLLRGGDHKVRWADAVQVCELTSVREFHLDPHECLDTDDLETIFERCGMRVPLSPLSPSTVTAS